MAVQRVLLVTDAFYVQSASALILFVSERERRR